MLFMQLMCFVLCCVACVRSSVSRVLTVHLGKNLHTYVFKSRILSVKVQDKNVSTSCGRLLHSGSKPQLLFLDQLGQINVPEQHGDWERFQGYSLFHRVWKRAEQHCAVEQQANLKLALLRLLGGTLVFPTLAQAAEYAKRSHARVPLFGVAEQRSFRWGMECAEEAAAMPFTLGACSDAKWQQLLRLQQQVRMLPEVDRQLSLRGELAQQAQALINDIIAQEQQLTEHRQQPCMPDRCV